MSRFTDEQWEEIASVWRKAAGQDDRIRFDAPEFVRWLKREGHIKDYICVPDRDSPHAKGKFDPKLNTVFYRQSTWDNAEHGDPHSIWTLIHETCHAIFKHHEVRYRATAPSRILSSAKASPDEFESNRLTACILAPFDKADFRQGMTVDNIMKRFGLSQDAAVRRLKEFERLYRHRHGIRRPLPPGIVDFLTMQERKGYRVTSLTNEHRLLFPVSRPAYEGDPCPSCGALALIRVGVSRRCEQCGARLGDD